MRFFRHMGRDLYTYALSKSASVRRIRHYQSRYDGHLIKSAAELVIPPWKADTGRREALLADYHSRQIYRIPDALTCLDAYDIISFDLFDTLLFRTVEKPVDVFALAEQETGAVGFQAARILAEQQARQKKFKATGTYEVTFEEIYCALPETVGGISRETLAGAELRLERDVCRVSPEMWRLVEALARREKRLLILSDMYLSARQLEDLLHASGRVFPGEIVVSSEAGRSKADGGLFSIALSGTGRVIHIGDNFNSDILMSRRARIPALHYVG